MTKAIVYTRFSPRPGADECESCEKQAVRCQEYARRMGYACAGEPFADKSVSGGELNRPALEEALEALNEGDVLIVDCHDRLARDMLVHVTIKARVAAKGARIEFASGAPVDTTPEGELLSNILAAFAAYERSRVRHATSRGLRRRQANGEKFGQPPAGWQRDPDDSKKWIENESEQEAIRVAHLLKGKGNSSEKIAEALTRRFGPFRGRAWSERTIRRILKR